VNIYFRVFGNAGMQLIWTLGHWVATRFSNW